MANTAQLNTTTSSDDKVPKYVAKTFSASDQSSAAELFKSLFGFDQKALITLLTNLSADIEGSKRLACLAPAIVNSSRKMKAFDFLYSVCRNIPCIMALSVQGNREGTRDDLNYSAVRMVAIAICHSSKQASSSEYKKDCSLALEKWENSEKGATIRMETKSKFDFNSSKMKDAVGKVLDASGL